MARFLTDCDPADETPVLRDLDVVSWRFECLTDAGYPVDIAVMLAERSDVDLHVACDLVLRGADVDQVLRILL